MSCSLLTPPRRLHFWRTQTGDEVDFVIEHGRRVVGIEVKMTDAPGYRHAAGLVRFLGEHPQAVGVHFVTQWSANSAPGREDRGRPLVTVDRVKSLAGCWPASFNGHVSPCLPDRRTLIV